MIIKNEESPTYHAICDCCFERSDEYETYHECAHCIKLEGWKAYYNKTEEEWEHFCPDCRE